MIERKTNNNSMALSILKVVIIRYNTCYSVTIQTTIRNREIKKYTRQTTSMPNADGSYCCTVWANGKQLQRKIK